MGEKGLNEGSFLAPLSVLLFVSMCTTGNTLKKKHEREFLSPLLRRECLLSLYSIIHFNNTPIFEFESEQERKKMQAHRVMNYILISAHTSCYVQH